MDTFRTLLRQSGALLIATLVVNVCSFALNLYVGRTLGPAQYGVLGALLSLFYLLVIPAGAIQTSAMRFASVAREDADAVQLAGLVLRFSRLLFIVSLVAAMVFVLGTPVLTRFFSFGSWWSIFALGLLLIATLFLSAHRGLLQGWHQFGRVSFNMVVEAISRSIFALLFIMLGFGAVGVIFGYAVAAIIGYCATWLDLPFPRQWKEGISLGSIVSFSGPVVATYILFAWMTNIDVLVAKRFLSEQMTGYYVANATLAKLLFFVSTALTDAMFTHVTSNVPNRRNSRAFYQTLVLDIALCALAICGGVLLANPIITTMYGPSYAAAAPYLGKSLLASFVFTLVIIYAKGFLARGETLFLPFLLLGGILQITLLLMFHRSLDDLLNVLLLSNFVTAAIMILFDNLRRNRVEHIDHRAQPPIKFS